MNKPVAWFLKYKDETYVECPSSVVGAIPLYTNPVKELTNDEMRKVINEIVDKVTVSEMVTFLAISKAILRKAQEK